MEHMKFLIKLFDFSNDKVQEASFFASIFSIISATILQIVNGITWFSNNILGVSVLLFVFLSTIMILDYITGLCAAIYEEKKKAVSENRKPLKPSEVFESKKGLGWVFKIGFYFLIIWGMNCFIENLNDKDLSWLGYPVIILQLYIISHIILWEIKSIDENTKRLGYNYPILGLFTKIFKIFSKNIEKTVKEK